MMGILIYSPYKFSDTNTKKLKPFCTNVSNLQ